MTAKEAMMVVVEKLRDAGYQALLAGGCVRDMLLGVEPYDYDVATDAVPETITSLFKRTLTVGAQFGVVVVLIKEIQIEVATFRSDVSYSDGRRPEGVVFTDAQHDAERRDFTINGMFYDPVAEKVIDYVGGREDLQKKVIRAIGNADERFAEDHLRMLRAIRFAARLDFEITPDTFDAICNHAANIKKISAERITAELEKTLSHHNRVSGAELCRQSGLLDCILPKVESQQFSYGIECMHRLPINADFATALGALLVNCKEKQVLKLCRHLKSSNEVRKQTAWLVANRPELLNSMPLSKGWLKKWLAQPYFSELTDLCRATATVDAADDCLGKLDELQQQIIALGDEEITPAPLLDGREIMALGVKPGPAMGKIVEEIYLAQLEGKITDKDQARQWLHDNGYATP